MYIEVTISSKNGYEYAYEVECEFVAGEKGDYFQPSVSDSYEVIKIYKNGKDVTKKLSEKIFNAIQDEAERILENY